jgi:hypothetical protein
VSEGDEQHCRIRMGAEKGTGGLLADPDLLLSIRLIQ